MMSSKWKPSCQRGVLLSFLGRFTIGSTEFFHWLTIIAFMRFLCLSLFLSSVSHALATPLKETTAESLLQDDVSLTQALDAILERTRTTADRELSHTIPPILTPRDCEYDFDHNFPDFTDQVDCPERCGGGATFRVTSLGCDENGRNCDLVVADCIVEGCTPGCNNVGDCPCTSFNLDTICEDYCPPPTPAPTVPPTAPPTEAPTPEPVPEPTPAPVSEPTAAPVPDPTSPPVSDPTTSPTAFPVRPPAEDPTPVAVPVATPVSVPVAVPVAAPVAAPVAPPVETPVTEAPVTTAPVQVPVTSTPVASEITSEPFDCYNSTDEILFDVIDVNTSEVTVFTLCPNTVYEIGSFQFDANGTLVSNGSVPLLARTNVHYACGLNGKVSDSCVLIGGDVQFLSGFTIFNEIVENALVKGITFRAAKDTGVVLTTEGDVTIEDCVLEVCVACQVMSPFLTSHHRITRTLDQ